MQQTGQPTNKDSKKRKKNSGENPPDKRHHESEDKQEMSMSVNPQNYHEMFTTQSNPLWVDPEPHVTT